LNYPYDFSPSPEEALIASAQNATLQVTTWLIVDMSFSFIFNLCRVVTACAWLRFEVSAPKMMDVQSLLEEGMCRSM
jgi:hypothetical protein